MSQLTVHLPTLSPPLSVDVLVIDNVHTLAEAADGLARLAKHLLSLAGSPLADVLDPLCDAITAQVAGSPRLPDLGGAAHRADIARVATSLRMLSEHQPSLGHTVDMMVAELNDGLFVKIEDWGNM